MAKHALIVLLLLSNKVSFTQTMLPAMFGDNMVLQQQQPVALWGKDDPKTRITVSGNWGKTATTITTDDGHWKLKLQTPAAGGPYTVVIKGSREIALKNVMIGEVWLCSGQSNMEMGVKGFPNQPVIGSNETILNSLNNNIRFFYTPHAASITPLYDVKSEWKAAAPSTTGNFSATAYYFAKKINAVLGVPVGIIQTAWGSSTVETWMDRETLSGFKNKPIPDKLPDSFPNRTPTILYNSMLHPYVGFTIKGALWYQGEANRDNAAEYHELFSAMINSWRKQWQQDSLSFYFAQIAPFEPGKVNAAFLREAQLKTMQTVKHTGMAVTLDIGERTVIHPSQKQQVGERLAYWAFAKDYNIKGLSYSGPVYRSMEKTPKGKIILRFDHSEQGLTSFGKPLTDFEIAGEDKVFYPAEAMIHNDKPGVLIVWNDSVTNPVSVRYGFKNWVQGSLFNTQGLPASSFRTDNW